ncbi:MAG: hypothetical protein RL076_539 [Chloroflexota bacterium]
MSGDVLSLPLFPLPLVLMPNAPLTLHVFEARYRAMIAACVAQRSTFAVVLVQHSATHSADLVTMQQMRDYLAEFPDDGDDEYPEYLPHLIATEAIIDEHVRFDDGRYGLQCHGGRRIQITGLTQRAPYLVATARSIPDTHTPAAKAAAFALRQMHERYWRAMQRASQQPADAPTLVEDDIALSWQLAQLMQVDNERKQLWLESSAAQRLRSMIIALRAERNTLPLVAPPTPFRVPWSWN